VRRVAFCPDGRHAFSAGSDRVLRLWDLDTGQEVRRFVGHPGEVTIMALSPDGRYVLSGNEGRHEAGKFVPDLKPVIRFWDVSTGKEVHQLRGHTNVARAIAFSPDGRCALSGSDDETLRLREVKSGKEVRRF